MVAEGRRIDHQMREIGTLDPIQSDGRHAGRGPRQYAPASPTRARLEVVVRRPGHRPVPPWPRPPIWPWRSSVSAAVAGRLLDGHHRAHPEPGRRHGQRGASDLLEHSTSSSGGSTRGGGSSGRWSWRSRWCPSSAGSRSASTPAGWPVSGLMPGSDAAARYHRLVDEPVGPRSGGWGPGRTDDGESSAGQQQAPAGGDRSTAGRRTVWRRLATVGGALVIDRPVGRLQLVVPSSAATPPARSGTVLSCGRHLPRPRRQVQDHPVGGRCRQARRLDPGRPGRLPRERRRVGAQTDPAHGDMGGVMITTSDIHLRGMNRSR